MFHSFSAKQYPNIIHSLDVWHKSKKLVKALTEVQWTAFVIVHTYMYIDNCHQSLYDTRNTFLQLSKGKNMQKISLWLTSIVNHFWYCCSEAKGDVAVLKVRCNFTRDAVLQPYLVMTQVAAD